MRGVLEQGSHELERREREARLYQDFVKFFAEHYVSQSLGGDEHKEWVKLYDRDPEEAEDYLVRCTMKRAKRSARLAFVEAKAGLVHIATEDHMKVMGNREPLCGGQVLVVDSVADRSIVEKGLANRREVCVPCLAKYREGINE